MSTAPANSRSESRAAVDFYQSRQGHVALAALLIVLTMATYALTFRGPFVLDDDVLVQNNRLVQETDGLGRIWFSKEPIDYWPVSNSSFWLEWRLWGASPMGYRVTNAVLHIATALMIWAVLRQLSIPGAYFAALLFALHPVNVGAVAWISQRKTLLATLFAFVSLYCYLRAEDSTGAPSNGTNAPPPLKFGWYFVSLVAFVVAVLSKGSVLTLPLLLPLVAWWRRRRVTPADLLRFAPFFLAAVPLVWVNLWFRAHGADEAIRSAGLVERILGAGTIPWFYLSKAILPVHLVFIYPQWNIQPSEVRWWLPLLASIAVTAILVWQRSTWWGRPLLFAWGFYWIALIPVLGFVDVQYMAWSLVADHYQYFALVAVTAVAAAAWHYWAFRRNTQSRPTHNGLSVAIALVAILSLVIDPQAVMYADPVALYQKTIDANPTCGPAYNNLGYALQKSDPQKAADQFRRALEFMPDNSEIHKNLGVLLLQLNQAPQAIDELRKAVQLRPRDPEFRNSLGAALLAAGQTQAAIDEFQEAIRLQPNFARAHNNLGIALLNSGHASEAVQPLERAVQLNPKLADAQFNLGTALLNLGRVSEAIDPLQRAVHLDPHFAAAQNNLGAALIGAQRLPEAAAAYARAAELRPDSLETWFNLATVDARLNRREEAAVAAKKALELARSQNETARAQQIEGWITSLESGQPAPPDSNPAIPPPTP